MEKAFIDTPFGLLLSIRYTRLIKKRNILGCHDQYDLAAKEIATVYKLRWNIEIFFGWLAPAKKFITLSHEISTEMTDLLLIYRLVSIISKNKNGALMQLLNRTMLIYTHILNTGVLKNLKNNDMEISWKKSYKNCTPLNVNNVLTLGAHYGTILSYGISNFLSSPITFRQLQFE